ncbi:MAG: AbiH family protein [Chitinophagales bacterium]
MNRLILIGNGFDLAHGLKTSYKDFFVDYLKDCIKQACYSERKYIDNRTYYEMWYDDILIKINSPLKPSSNNVSFLSHINSLETISDIIKFSSDYNVTILGRNNNKFSNNLLNECITKNWVDIERLYYEELKKCLIQYNKDKDYNGKTPIGNLVHLNNQLDFIKDKLKEYLTKVQPEGVQRIDEIEKIIYNSHPVTNTPNKILFLNFNYTNIAEKYVKTITADLINIHGQLLDIFNEIIFGYGDEVDKNYKEIEDLNENEFFKHIKSFDYFKTSNYKNLLRFINDDLFEVFVMGHSCGLSDRTLLNSIFEDKNCQSIKIFDYRKDPNNYRDKTYEISRHFRDKESMRRKIVELEKCSPMPQHDDK